MPKTPPGVFQLWESNATLNRGSAQSAESAVLRVTAQQGELLELLAEDLAKRRRDALQLELALGLRSPETGQAPGVPAGQGYPGMRPAP
ncbi:unnamed protein product [Symbiodinium natans]|uniref:Uncharacterized protein n=1 Tax=Symbiodinium natans TaxID=878477 RepID=A0A812RBT1_9DINO|nr:unnamed protein product [Symbiodinium natans]